MNTPCESWLTIIHHRFPVFQIFQPTLNQQIIECFNQIIDSNQVIKTGFAVDYWSYHWIYHPEKYTAQNVSTQLNQLLSHSMMYSQPLKDLSTLIHSSAIPQTITFSAESQQLLYQLFIYQTWIILSNYSKQFPSLFQRIIEQPHNLISILVYQQLTRVDDLMHSMQQLTNYINLWKYHDRINGPQLILYATKLINQNDLLQQIEGYKIYLYLIGLVITKQLAIGLYNHLAQRNQPTFPTELNNELVGQEALIVPENSNQQWSVKLTIQPFDASLSQPMSNYITRNKLIQWLSDDHNIELLIKSEQQMLQFKLNRYMMLNQSHTLSKIRETHQSITVDVKRKQMELILNQIATIKGRSFQLFRRFLYTQIYLFGTTPELLINVPLNCLLVGSESSGQQQLADVLAFTYNHLGLLYNQQFTADQLDATDSSFNSKLDLLQEKVIIVYQLTQITQELKKYMSINQGLSVLLIATDSSHISQLNSDFTLFQWYPQIIVLPRLTTDDLNAFLDQTIGQELEPTTADYLHQLIGSLNLLIENGQQIFNHPIDDMIRLSQIIHEESILEPNGINTNVINRSLQQFLMLRGFYFKLQLPDSDITDIKQVYDILESMSHIDQKIDS